MRKEFLLVFEDFHVSKRIVKKSKKHLVVFQGQLYYNKLVVVNRPPGFSHALESIMYSDKILETVGFTTLFAVPVDRNHSIPFKFVRIGDNTPKDCKIVLDKREGMEQLNILPLYPVDGPLSPEDKQDILSYLSLKSDDGTVTYLMNNPQIFKGKGKKQEE
ncbi:hypothetical protein [Rossellomorea vietnamensis]|uniref:Uncharacterized protein n=1 Tax=Rossellomorea vietnamensis TaxID=218284 RepID=A0A0P6W2H3_9BACI|nr:hypothetical protein [Rossellomorea vietnamensis]KPL59326.1 hypothetical protein AM506_12510 [Rossellomorea vietnamensis]